MQLGKPDPMIRTTRNSLIVQSLMRGNLRDDPHLPQLLVSAIRPQRAIAFEQLSEAEALAKHPELKGAYDGMRKMRGTIAENFPNNARAQQQLLLRAKSEIVRTLDSGKVLPPRDQARATPAKRRRMRNRKQI